MANIIEITDLNAEELLPYTDTSEKKLLDYFSQGDGIFTAESPKVIRTALDSGYEPLSLLLERKYISGQAADIIGRCGDIPVYTASSSVLEKLTGFKLTQGALCAMRRKKLPTPQEILAKAERIAVLEDVMNQTNIGAVFRSAAALGFDAVLLTPSCSDPLFRRTVRVSMGTVFQLPWTYLGKGAPDYITELKAMGFACAAMALRRDTVRIDDERLRAEPKLAVILGTEGNGLRDETIDRCDHTIKIPMANGVDSLNVAAASAVAFFQLSKNI
ncbi:MAG: RNA methyltransferase [Ruminococcus sp.]|uniref:TrmH family RNA methyltransferase n=1 Tax=Ruminococcus sp. TaxID=41978 RepID=UPI0025D2DE68|nr:RNA methyltransferase [Ruminococcus sp.]MBR5682759.1 RNA methyltransferase [Ruminococcus sp.]